MKKNKIDNSILDILAPSKAKDFFADRSIAAVHDFYLSGPVENPEYYVEWFDIIRNCSEADTVRIHINSCGGDLFAAIQLMRVLSECPGTVITSVEGACMSAATMIFLSADVFEVSGHTMFMFHNYAGGVFGKGGEMYGQIVHERDWSAKLLKDIYSDFLTKKEIKAMLDNKDIWMDGEEVVKRLEKRADKFKQREKQQ